MTQLQITLLGPFRVSLSGEEETEFESNKVRALLTYLAVEQGQHPRGKLATLFWPDHLETNARTNLRQVLYQLRRSIGDETADPPYLLISRQSIGLNPAAAYTLDVSNFRTLLAATATHAHEQLTTCISCLDRLRQAVALYHSDFLTGFALDDSDLFEEWRRIIQEQLHLQALDALHQLTTAATIAGDRAAILRYARHQLLLEPWREEAHRQLMRTLAESGQRAAAVAQYKLCCDVLSAEVGVGPDAETVSLYEQIQQGQIAKKGMVQAGGEPHQPLRPPRSHLPIQLTTFVGREADLNHLIAQLQQPQTRLFTLVGPGGVGKTRLALEAARRLEVDGHTWPPETDNGPFAAPEEHGTVAHPTALTIPTRTLRFPDGIFFVELATLRNAAALAPALATALAIPLSGGNPEQLLLNALADRRLLLILDNCEHLLTTVPLIVEILRAAPNLQILATSREPLSIQGEALYFMRGLTYAPDAQLQEAATSAAVRLFCQRAQRVQTNFYLDESNLPAVLRICRLVEGTPLGLELAAAWMELLSPQEIAEEIQNRTDFLAADWQNIPERQRSMRAVFAWSWQLLTPNEQLIFCKLALFQNGFTREAAVRVAGGNLRTLAMLARKSLIRREERGGAAAARYAIHELLRQFAAEQLAALPDEQAETEQRYCAYYLTFLSERATRLQKNDPRRATNEIFGELENIRHAWELAAQRQLLVPLEQSTIALREFYIFAGLVQEGSESFALAIDALRKPLPSGQEAAAPNDQEAAAPNDQEARARLLSRLIGYYGSFLISIGDHVNAQAAAEEALQLGQTHGELLGEAVGALVFGQARRRLGHSTEAQLWLQRAVEIAQRQAQSATAHSALADIERRAYGWLCSITLNLDDYHTAQSYAQAGLQICRSSGRLTGEVACLTDVVDVALLLGDYNSAQRECEQALALAQKVDFRWGVSVALWTLGKLLRLQGKYSAAIGALEQAASIYHLVGQPVTEVVVKQELVRLFLYLGDYARARQTLDQAQQLLQSLHFPAWETYITLLPAALLADFTGDYSQAQRDAEAAWQMAKQLYGSTDQADALVVRGLVMERMADPTAAVDSYQQALDRYDLLGLAHRAVEALAGLARLALHQGDLGSAQRHVDRILPLLAERTQVGLDEPFLIYLTCYKVLSAQRDPRALTLLTEGDQLLQRYVDNIHGDSLRRSFLEEVPTHRELRLLSTMLQQTLPAAEEPLTTAPWFDGAEMPQVYQLFGRATELAQLARWLTRESARLIAITGMGGAGKTTVAARVVGQSAHQFEVVIWRSLLNAPPPEEILRNWLQIFSRQHPAELPATFAEQSTLLLHYLRQQRALLILDNLESILVAGEQTGEMRPGYADYASLLQTVGSGHHQSVLLITTRELPEVLEKASRPSNPIRTLALNGLDSAAGQAILQAHGLQTVPHEMDALVAHYSGNPLALQIAANTIVDLFGGDAAAFRQEELSIFDGIRAVLDQQFARLSDLERDLLIWLAIEREAITLPILRANLVPQAAAAAIVEALRSLEKRSLLVKTNVGVTLQNVITDYVTERLIEGIHSELSGDVMTKVGTEVGERSARSWLNRFALIKADSKEDVRQSQVRLILAPLAERLLAHNDKAALVPTLKSLIDLWRQRALHLPGYTAGNLVNLLLQLGADLAGYDLSGLCVWQADLRAVSAPALNLTGANLAHSRFMEAFGFLYTVVLTPDGSRAAAAGGDGAIRFWRFDDGTLERLFRGHHGMVRSIALAGDGLSFVSGGDDYTVRIWQIHQDECIRTLTGHRSHVLGVAISPDGQRVASGSADRLIKLWSMHNGAEIATLEAHDGWVRAVAFSPDGRYLASGSYDQTVRLWDAQDGKPLKVLRGHAGIVTAVAFHPNSRWVASASTDGTLRFWDLQTDGCHTLPSRKGGFWSTAFSPNGALLAGGDNSTLYLWAIDPDSWLPEPPSVAQFFTGHTNAIQGITFTAESRTVISSSGDQSLRIWDTQSGQIRRIIQGHSQAIQSLVFGVDSLSLVASSTDRLIRRWDLSKRRVTGTFTGHTQSIESIAMSPRGSLLASGSTDGTVRIWSLQDPAPQCAPATRILLSEGADIAAVAFSPDGTRLASASQDRLRLWEVQSGRLIQELGNGEAIYALAFHPQAKVLATGHSDNLIRLWDLDRGTVLETLAGHSGLIWSLAFSPDGSYLASGSFDFTVRLWQVSLPAPTRLHATLTGHTGRVFSVAFSPDGTFVASGSSDQTLRIWETSTQQLRHCCRGHEHWIWSVAVSPDGRTIASGSIDETIRLWESESGACMDTLRAPGPYEGMKITGVTGISDAQRAALKALGAVEE